MRTITAQSHPEKFWGISELCQTQQQVRVPLHAGLSHTPFELWEWELTGIQAFCEFPKPIALFFGGGGNT